MTKTPNFKVPGDDATIDATNQKIFSDLTGHMMTRIATVSDDIAGLVEDDAVAVALYVSAILAILNRISSRGERATGKRLTADQNISIAKDVLRRVFSVYCEAELESEKDQTNKPKTRKAKPNGPDR
jgi:ascorbate-specific PTS system EIIC-type component UlaA